MSKLVDEPLDEPPVLDAKKRPLTFRWRRSRYRVANVLDRWMETGQWWEGEKEYPVWRVELTNGGIMELGCKVTGWVLFKIYD